MKVHADSFLKLFKLYPINSVLNDDDVAGEAHVKAHV